MNQGVLYAVAAYVSWGLFPIYWRWLQAVPALQVISHRMLWSCLLLGTFLIISRQWRQFRARALSWRSVRLYLLAALLVGCNWLIYIWAVNAGYIIETSLGYFINPLLSVLLAVCFLGEKLRPLQWLPVALAAAGVLYLTFLYGRLPWIALSLATTFALYGLVKKTAPLSSLYGLTLETALLFPFALVYLLYCQASGQGAFLHSGERIDWLLLGGGAVTTLPLLLFATAAQRIPLLLIGVLQYITPTMQFLLGIWVFHEPFSEHQLIGFGLVWMALIIFVAEQLLARRSRLARA